MRTEVCQSVLQSVAEPKMATGAELPILARFAVRGEIASLPVVLRKYRSHADSVYSSEVATISTKPMHHRVLIDIVNVYRLRLDQMAVLFSSSYSTGFKYRIFGKVLFSYFRYFFSKALKIPAKLAGLLTARVQG